MRQTLVIMATIIALGGCADDNVSVFILGNIAPEKEDDSCTYDPASMDYVPRGVWDINVTSTYFVTVAIANQLQPRGSTVRSEPNGVNLVRAEVTLQNFAGTPFAFAGLPNPFSVPMSAYIGPAQDFTTPSLGGAAIEVVPPDYAQGLREMGVTDTTILAQIRVAGETNGHIDIETDDWQWPITICSTGCLSNCTTDEADVSLACRRGQDQASTGLCP